MLDSYLHNAAKWLTTRYKWQLLTTTAWVEAAYKINPSPVDEKAARRACLRVYAQTLYAACQDPNRREQAYQELYDYLWPWAYYKIPEFANEATQDAIILIYRSFTETHLTKCNDAKAFLYFAQLKLKAAIKELFSRLKREEGDDIGGGNVSNHDSRPEIELLRTEQAEWLAATTRRVALQVLDCLANLWQHSRLRKQLSALISTFMDRSNDQAIAIRLKTTPKNVEVLRTRGLDKVQLCLNQHIVERFRSFA